MTKIDTSTWKEFQLSSIIEKMYICKSLDFGKLSEGKTAFVNRSAFNNGIQGYVEVEPYEQKNCITVGMVGNSKHAFWQEVDFVASQNILVLRNKKWSKNIGLFICSLINNYLKDKCEYNEILKKDTFDNVKVLLPIKEIEEPDWAYMENYIKNIEKRVSVTLTALKEVRGKQIPIEIKEWGSFNVGDLFEIYPTKGYKETNKTLFVEGGKNPVVVNSSFNNGVGGYTNKEPTEKAGIITFSDTTTADSIFYQDKDFVGYAHVQGVHPIGVFKDCWNKNSLQFFVSAFKSAAKGKNYDYTNKFTRESASKLTVYLPIKSDNSPDFEYMDNYIKSVYGGGDKCTYDIDRFGELIWWEKFKIKELFIVKRPIKRNIFSYEDGHIPFVASGNYNNGIIGYCESEEKLDRGNCLSVSPVDGSCFYQEIDFLGRGGAGSSILLLYNDNLNKYNGLFLSSLIGKVCSKYSYNNMGSIDMLKEEIIMLPLNELGQPNFNYMDNFIRNKLNSERKRLEILKKINYCNI